MKNLKNWIAVFVLMLVCVSFAETRLLRFPHIHKDKIVFVYAGDLYLVSSNGGVARKLTTHDGFEVFPRFSPNGKWIAYTAEYSGQRQVYIIPAEGGEPKRLTFYPDIGKLPPRGGWDYQIMDWTPDSKKILVRCNRVAFGERLGKYFLVDPKGGFEEELILPEGGLATYSPEGNKIAYNRISREFRTWKRYRGGRAQDVWIYDFPKNKLEQVTKNVATDNFPLWVGDKIYFTSDRDNKLNLYQFDTSSKTTKKVTEHKDYDVLWPSRGEGGIVYENGGYIHLLDPATNTSKKLAIEVLDDKPMTRPYYKAVNKNIESYWLSPSAKRALFEARGDIFTVPAENGDVRNITKTQGMRERTPAWSPDGKWIVYQSDATGEYEFYLTDPIGEKTPKQITDGNDVWTFQPVWSPDSKMLVFSDKKMRLRILDVESGKITKADVSKYSDIGGISWSSDSKWIAFTKDSENQMAAIWVYSLEKKKAFQLTDDNSNDTNPVFDPNGKYIYFVSQRDFNLTFSEYEFDYFYDKSNRIYLATLEKETPSPFEPNSDEEEVKEEKAEKSEEKKEDDKKTEKKSVTIDVDGFTNRIIALDVPSGGYRSLNATEKGPLYMRTDKGKTTLKMYDLESRKEETIMDGINGYDLTYDGKKMIYSSHGKYGIADVKPGQKPDGKLGVNKMVMQIDPKKEWQQMFAEVWRIERDWFYEPSMHGVDWNEMKERYGQLVPFVSHRADLDYILGELVGELAAGHTYVQSGDEPKIDRVDVGLLGAKVEPTQSGLYRISKIYQGENWHKAWRSPLTEPGVDVKVGDYVLAINGNKITTKENFYKYFENTVGTTVTLKIKRDDETKDVKIKPIAKEQNLRYLDWITKNRKYVEEKTDGRVGYIHLPNTAGPGNRELFRWFYAQASKEALVIDVRYNGGGFIPEKMIELLQRPIMSYWARRNGVVMQTPGFAHIGPKVCLINEYASSGGDAFPYYFKKFKLGPLIGKRTWGGLIGYSGSPGLVDGGSVTVPAFSFFDTEGKWDVENIGVAPDIEVDQNPELVIQGKDPQLDRAIKEVLKLLKQANVEKPDIPDYPKR
jgi:tricorn protease